MKAVKYAFVTLGVLLAVAIAYFIVMPPRADYIIRSKVQTHLVNAAGACKTSVAEFYQAQRRMPADETEAQCRADPSNLYAGAPRVKGGAITVSAAGTLKAQLEALGSGIVFQYTPVCEGGPCNGSPITRWDCVAGTTVDAKQLPAICRP